MFDNVGSRIKGVAQVICWVGIIVSCILGIMNIMSGMTLNSNHSGTGSSLVMQGLVILVAGSIASWIGSLMAYGFGELIENSAAISRKLDGQYEGNYSSYTASNNSSNLSAAANSNYGYHMGRMDNDDSLNSKWICAICGRENPNSVVVCQCGRRKPNI